jgi:hypothetical protein
VIGELVQIKKNYFNLSEKGYEVRGKKNFFLTGSRPEDNAVIFETNDPLKVDWGAKIRPEPVQLAKSPSIIKVLVALPCIRNSLADQYRSCIQSSRQTTIESEITAQRSRTIVFTDSNGQVRTLEQQGQRVVIDGVDLNQLSSDERAQRIAEFEAEYNDQQSVREQARNLRLRPLNLPNWDGSSTEAERPRQRRLGGTIDIETNDRQGECTNQIVINGQAHQVCSGTYTFDQDGNMTTQSGL